jgi:predicted DNA-binding protein
MKQFKRPDATERKTKFFACRLTPSVYEALRKASKDEGVKMSALASEAIEQFVDWLQLAPKKAKKKKGK